MRRWLFVPTLAVASLVLAGPAAATSTKDNFGLKGEVYAEGFKIEMKNANNRKLTRVRAGTYRIKVEDEAKIHNFHLRGPGVNKTTSIPRRSEQIWTVKLLKGTYTFVCDPHARFMHGTFRVT